MSAFVEATGLALSGRLAETSLALSAGSLTCLVGPNGSGKTSLLHALAGINGAMGHVNIDGIDPQSLGPSQRSRLLTYLPATREPLWPLAARDLIALGGASGEEIDHAIALLELEGVMGRRADQLSTGERSRVLIARALATEPRLLLLDEPTANLDPLWQIRLMELLKTRVWAKGQAALVAIHDLDAASRHADRILVMSGGRIAAEGLDGRHVAEIFGIERTGGRWQPVRPPADRRSSR